MGRYSELNWGQKSRANLLIVAGGFTSSRDALRKLSNSSNFAEANVDLHSLLVKRPSGQKPFVYDDRYVSAVFTSAWRYILRNKKLPAETESEGEPDLTGMKISAWNDDSPEVCLNYKFICLVYRDSHNNRVLLDYFSPVFHSIPFDSKSSTQDLMGALHDTAKKLNHISSMFSKQISTGAHRSTPLLLPNTNFKHNQKTQLFRYVTEFPYETQKILKKIQATRKSLRVKSTDIFLDEREVSFQPGEPHGDNVVRAACLKEISCTLNGCFRFGTPYPMNFHYNVQHTKANKVTIFDCLDGASILDQGNYVNIAPNDRLR